jgi:uncharacterized membrane protein
MSQPTDEHTELFLQFSQRKLTTLLLIVLAVGAVGLALMLTPTGSVWRAVSRVSLVPVAVAIVLIVQMTLRGRRWSPDSPEVRMAMQDEWRRTNMNRASRLALVVVLLAQWPLALVLGFTQIPAPRGAMAMAMASITIGLATQIALFLFFDRE